MKTHPSVLTAGLALSILTGAIVSSANAQAVDRNANLRFIWVAGPAAYDPPMAKNQFQDMPYELPIYDGLVRLDAAGNVIPSIAQSWETSADKLTLTFKLRPGIKFTDGSDVNADAVVKSLNRTKSDPNSLLAGQMATFESFEAKDPSTVVTKLKTPDVGVLYVLASSTGMIVSAKALADGVSLGTNPVGSGPYKLVSSGPQGATYERNEDYFDKSQNQFAKVTIGAVVDVPARLNALISGQADAGMFQLDQVSYAQIKQMVSTGKFKLHAVLQPNSIPLWLNTKIKPFDNPKVRMAMNLIIDRDAINTGIQNGECKPASQPLQPGVVGHDDKLVAYKADLPKAKKLLEEAGVGPFSFDAIVSTQEPVASVAIAMKEQLKAAGITMNILPTPGVQTRPLFRGGTYGGMVMTMSVQAPDPASIINAIYMSADNPGGVSPEFAKAFAEAKTKSIGSPEREAAYKALSKMAYDDPRQVFTCWAPILIVARKDVMGLEKTPYVNAAPFPDIRNYSIVKSN